jgi:hypothetical protein
MIPEIIKVTQETLPHWLSVISLAAPALGAVLVKINPPYFCQYIRNLQYGRQFPEGTDKGNAKVISQTENGNNKVEYILIPSGAGTFLTLTHQDNSTALVQIIAHRVTGTELNPNAFQVGGALKITRHQRTFKQSVFRDRPPFQVLLGVTARRLLDYQEMRILNLPPKTYPDDLTTLIDNP